MTSFHQSENIIAL